MKSNSTNFSFSARVGFTLIELLVAVGVTALLVSLMLTIVVNVMGGWNRSSGSLTSGNQARTVLDIIGRDLQSAIFKRNGDVWLAASVQTNGSGSGTAWGSSGKPATVEIPAIPASTDPLPSLETAYKFGQAGVWLRFFATIPGSNSGTDISAPRAISYQIVRNSVSGSSVEQRYMLYRSEVTPAATFTNGYNLFNPLYYSGELRSPPADTVIANNVVDFGVRCFKRNATNQLDLIFPDSTDLCFAATSDSTKVGPGTAENAPKRNFPDVVEVYIRVLTDEGAQQIANLESGRITGDWWEIVNANSRVYSRRVEIKGTSL
jgi:type II secretory pathway pseudopilin PulG